MGSINAPLEEPLAPGLAIEPKPPSKLLTLLESAGPADDSIFTIRVLYVCLPLVGLTSSAPALQSSEHTFEDEGIPEGDQKSRHLDPTPSLSSAWRARHVCTSIWNTG